MVGGLVMASVVIVLGAVYARYGLYVVAVAGGMIACWLAANEVFAIAAIFIAFTIVAFLVERAARQKAFKLNQNSN